MPKLVPAALLTLAGALLLGLFAQQSVAATSCHLSSYEQRHLGTSYVLNVKKKRVSCAKAKKVVKAYHKCRHRSGGADGRCHRKVARGWKCSETRLNQIPTQYDARMTCKKGRARVWSTYTQFT